VGGPEGAGSNPAGVIKNKNRRSDMSYLTEILFLIVVIASLVLALI